VEQVRELAPVSWDSKVRPVVWSVNRIGSRLCVLPPGQPFVALNGGPEFTFNEAISFQVGCASQAEVDDFWAKLTDGGEEGPCGWLKDRFGVSWQIVPVILDQLLADPDPGRSQRAMKAMLGMKKLDIAELERAADGS